jgi:hypothetical protein
MHVPHHLPSVSFVAQMTNQSPLSFESQTVTVILRPKSPNHGYRFWGPNWKTVTTGFEPKPGETITTSLKDKPEKTVTTSFEAKPEKTILVVLRPNHWQTV